MSAPSPTWAVSYACVLVTALLPYVWVAVAKTGAPRYDNRAPRAWLAQQASPRVQRAHAAHLNAFEAFPPFATGVILSQLAGVPAVTVAWLACAFVLARLAHGTAYVVDRPLARSGAWFVGLACMVALHGLAIGRALGG